MDWRLLALTAMMFYGVGTFLTSKSNPIHGPLVACFLQMLAYAAFLAFNKFDRTELTQVTKFSLMFGTPAAFLFVIGSFTMFKAIAAHPEKTALISIIANTWPIITALLMQLSGHYLNRRQWFGVLLVTIGMMFIVPKTK